MGQNDQNRGPGQQGQPGGQPGMNKPGMQGQGGQQGFQGGQQKPGQGGMQGQTGQRQQQPGSPGRTNENEIKDENAIDLTDDTEVGDEKGQGQPKGGRTGGNVGNTGDSGHGRGMGGGGE